VTNQQWLARACPPEFGSNHGLVWLMIGYSRDQPTSVPVRARSVDTLIADIAKRPRHVREVPIGDIEMKELAIEFANYVFFLPPTLAMVASRVIGQL
jgi:hypothetical protein